MDLLKVAQEEFFRFQFRQISNTCTISSNYYFFYTLGFWGFGVFLGPELLLHQTPLYVEPMSAALMTSKAGNGPGLQVAVAPPKRRWAAAW